MKKSYNLKNLAHTILVARSKKQAEPLYPNNKGS